MAGLLGCGVMAGLGAAINTGERRARRHAWPSSAAAAWATPPSPVLGWPAPQRSSRSTSTTGSSSWAKDFGATHTVNAGRPTRSQAIRELTDGIGADVTIEAVGRPEVSSRPSYARDLAGTVVLVGVPTPGHDAGRLPLIEFFGRGGSLKSSWYGDCLPSRDFPMLVDLHLQGRLPLDAFVSETIGLDEVEEAFHKMERGEVLRSVVVL